LLESRCRNVSLESDRKLVPLPGCTCNPTRISMEDAFTGMHPHTNPQSRCPPQPFPPIPGSMFLYCISYKRQHGSACVLAGCGVQSSRVLVALWPTCVVLSGYISGGRGRGPCGLPSPRIFLFLGDMKAAFVPSPSPGPWRARRLDSADVDSRVWLTSTRTYIAFAVPFIIWIHSRLRC